MVDTGGKGLDIAQAFGRLLPGCPLSQFGWEYPTTANLTMSKQEDKIAAGDYEWSLGYLQDFPSRMNSGWLRYARSYEKAPNCLNSRSRPQRRGYFMMQSH